MPKIAVFAGHGGSDFGAIGNGLREKDLNLALSNEVTKILRQNGYEVLNNRTTDVNRSITADANLANNEKVDAVVEIHQNSNSGIPGTGTEVLYSIKDTGKGKALAQAIVDKIAALGFKNRGIKTAINLLGQDTFAILRLSNAPTALVETAFINNPVDMELFDVNKISKAIAEGIMQIFPVSSTPSKPTTGDSVVKSIQSTLNQRYSANLIIDGVAGAKTKQALVKGLQTELNRQYNANLKVDGAFRPSTASALKIVRKGARGSITYLIQAALYLKGYKVTPDGVFGDQTETAIREFQRDNGLTVDGIAGPATQTALFSK